MSARETWPYFQRESIARTAAWNAVRPGNIVSRIGFAPKIASAGRKFEERRRERNSCAYIERTANCLPQWILRFFGCNGVKWARFECRSIRFKEIRVDGLSGLLRKDRILPILFSPRREFMGDADQICRRRRVIPCNACVSEERRKRESERVVKRWSNSFYREEKRKNYFEEKRTIFAKRKISIDEMKRIASKAERKCRIKNLLIENITYESIRIWGKGRRKRGKGNFR